MTSRTSLDEPVEAHHFINITLIPRKGNSMKHQAPFITIDQHRHDEPNRWDFIRLVPDATHEWTHRPLGTGQPQYAEHDGGRVDSVKATEIREEMKRAGYVEHLWHDVPEYFREWLIENIVPLEFKSHLRADEESYTARYVIWVQGGTIPAQRLDSLEEILDGGQS